jgi:hypothetical protein
MITQHPPFRQQRHHECDEGDVLQETRTGQRANSSINESVTAGDDSCRHQDSMEKLPLASGSRTGIEVLINKKHRNDEGFCSQSKKTANQNAFSIRCIRDLQARSPQRAKI